jgi:hypothetical protein
MYTLNCLPAPISKEAMYIAVVTNGGYNRRNVFRSPVGAKDFFLRQSIQRTVAYPVSYFVDTRHCFYWDNQPTGAYPVSYFMDMRHCFYWSKVAGGVKLTYRHLVSTLGMSERTKPASVCLHGIHRDTFTFLCVLCA